MTDASEHGQQEANEDAQHKPCIHLQEREEGGKGGRVLVRHLPCEAAMRGCTLVGGRWRHERPKGA